MLRVLIPADFLILGVTGVTEVTSPEAGQLLSVSSWYLCNPCLEAVGLQG
jgi:hypothetical protein